jgi:hypothetical protein
MVRRVCQLDLGYRESSLSLGGSGGGYDGADSGVRAGDRAPDAPLVGAAGQPTRLFALLRGPHWTLLGYDPDGSLGHSFAARPGLRVHTVGPGGDVHDDEGLLGSAYGLVGGAWVLIRPDGYLAAVLPAAGAAALDAYLDRVGLTVAEMTGQLSPAG